MLNLIPKINGKLSVNEGVFKLSNPVSVGTEFPETNEVFAERVSKLGNYMVETSGDPVIVYRQDDIADGGYRIEITPRKISVFAAGGAGYSNGLVSLYQLLATGDGEIACCTFSDSPKYERRSFMLDVCRHFFPVDEVKKILEQCALLKINQFHWHLSEDQGYRIESRRFPKLNEISSYRKLSGIDPLVTGGFNKEGDIYGGYYTQDEIRDVVEFARKRGIDVVPEIDLPGHSSAILAAYPEYTCSGEELEVVNTFGIFPRIFCAGKAESYHFLYELLDEVCELFPSQYIHIGGDEAPKDEWKQCPHCNGTMEEKGYTDYEQLQAFFTEKLIAYLATKGRTPLVWNESTASGELDAGAVVQYWLEMEPGESYVVPEIGKGRKFIMSSMNQFYFDYSYAEIPMKSTLMYDPEMKGTPVPAENVLGIEAPMWNEWVPNCEVLERMIYPRLHALAESAWTEERDYDDFIGRLEKYLQVDQLNLLKGMPWEDATISGQAALDMIVTKMIELSKRFSSMQAAPPENMTEAELAAERERGAARTKAFIYEKMKAAYTNDEIKQVQDRILEGRNKS